MKTRELTGHNLDLAVALALGYPLMDEKDDAVDSAAHGGPPVFYRWLDGRLELASSPYVGRFIPSEIWALGGMLLEKFHISVRAIHSPEHESSFYDSSRPELGQHPRKIPAHRLHGKYLAKFFGYYNTSTSTHWGSALQGDTYLEAGMRAVVFTKFGEEVPDDLLAALKGKS